MDLLKMAVNYCDMSYNGPSEHWERIAAWSGLEAWTFEAFGKRMCVIKGTDTVQLNRGPFGFIKSLFKSGVDLFVDGNIKKKTLEYRLTKEKYVVHSGFYSHAACLVHDLLGKIEYEEVFLIGHSLGGATATLAALLLRKLHGVEATVITVGAPMAFHSDGGTPHFPFLHRITRFDDPVPRLPPLPGWQHPTGGWIYRYTEGGFWETCPSNKTTPYGGIKSHHTKTGYMPIIGDL